MDPVIFEEIADAFQQGHVLDCGAGQTGRRVLDGDLIRRCCGAEGIRVDPRGIRIRNAVVAGCVELAAMTVPFPIRFDSCEFESALALDGAVLYELAITRCPRVPGMLANGLQIRRDLDLSGSYVTGGHRTTASTTRRAAIWLCESDIGGRVLCVDTTIRADGERAIQADRMHVGGTVRLLHQFTATGEIRLVGANIDGSVDLTGARVESAAPGPAVDLAEAAIAGSVFLVEDMTGRRPVIHGRLDMGSTRIGGQFLIRDAIIKESAATPAARRYDRSWASGSAISAPRLTVGADMTMDGTCEVTGGIDLAMSEMSSLHVAGRCSFHAPGRTAINATNAELRSTLTLSPGVTVAGTIRLSGARIHGNLAMRGTVLTEPEGNSLLAAQGLAADGEVELQDIRAAGGRLVFRGATIGSVLNAAGAHLTNPAGDTLNLHQATVKGSVRLISGFESTGLLVLNRATIEGRLECTDGSFTCPAPFPRNPGGHAIEAISATIRGGMDLGWTSASPSIDLTDATTSFLADDPANWPPRFIISGFSYDRFEDPQGAGSLRKWDMRSRREWLTRQAAYDSSPYEQAARVFRQHGHAADAEAILIAQRRQARHAINGPRNLPRRIRDIAYSTSVGYGYRPGRILWLLAALLILVLASLEVPAWQATLRAATVTGAVYTTRRPQDALPGSSPASGHHHPPQPGSPACGDGEIRCFNATLYAFDTVLPLISLDQRSVWYPDPRVRYGSLMQWWLNIATLLGWLLSSIFLLSLARLARDT